MTSIQFQSGSSFVLNAIIDETRIFAYGTHAPALIIPVAFQNIAVNSLPSDTVHELATLSGEISVAPKPGAQENLSAAAYCPISSFAPHAPSVQLHFPLRHQDLSWIETVRNGGESISFFLNLRLVSKKLRVRENDRTGPRYDYLGEISNSGQAAIQISRETWVKVLEATKFGSVHVFEFPAFPIEQCSSLKNAFAALKKAQRDHLQGDYDGAIGNCRVAIDKFWQKGPKKLKDAWLEKINTTNHKWLNEIFTAIRQGSNEPHHTALDHFGQFESQLFIAVTTAYIAYVARAGVTEE